MSQCSEPGTQQKAQSESGLRCSSRLGCPTSQPCLGAGTPVPQPQRSIVQSSGLDSQPGMLSANATGGVALSLSNDSDSILRKKRKTAGFTNDQPTCQGSRTMEEHNRRAVTPALGYPATNITNSTSSVYHSSMKDSFIWISW